MAAFDKMVEAAAKAPRKFGLAPKSSEAFKTDAVSLNIQIQKFLNVLLNEFRILEDTLTISQK